MGLRTQVDPHVLVGDSLADLPAPGNIPQGTIFYEFGTGQARILVENSSTHVRSWDTLGGGGGAGFSLQFFAQLPVSADPLTFFLTTANFLFAPVGFVLPVNATGFTVEAHLVGNALTTGELTVAARKNGADVADGKITAASADTTLTLTASSAFAANVDRFDLSVAGSDGGAATETIVVTVAFR